MVMTKELKTMWK